MFKAVIPVHSRAIDLESALNASIEGFTKVGPETQRNRSSSCAAGIVGSSSSGPGLLTPICGLFSPQAQ